MKLRFSIEDAFFLAALALVIAGIATGQSALAITGGVVAVVIFVRVAARVLRRPKADSEE